MKAFLLGSTTSAELLDSVSTPSCSNQNRIRQSTRIKIQSSFSVPTFTQSNCEATPVQPNEDQTPTSGDHSPLLKDQGTPSGPKSKSFPCLQCFNVYSFKSQLDRHMISHTGERPFKCKYCGKGFNHQGARDNHQGKFCQKNTQHLCQ